MGLKVMFLFDKERVPSVKLCSNPKLDSCNTSQGIPMCYVTAPEYTVYGMSGKENRWITTILGEKNMSMMSIHQFLKSGNVEKPSAKKSSKIA